MRRLFAFVSILSMLSLFSGYANAGPLHSAALTGDTNTLTRLLNEGADVNAKDNYGRTPLSLAAYRGKTDVAELLISKGADIDYVIVKLENVNNVEAKAGVKVLERLKEKQKIASQTQPETPVKIKPQTAYIPKPAVTVKETAAEDIHNIPDFKSSPRHNDLAVIIGIENYRGLPKSDYSKSDAGMMKDYLKALGFQERNVTFLTDDNASLSDIKKTLETWLHNKAKKESKVFIYYSGHGAPEPKTGDAYIVPFDGDPNYLEDTGYSLRRLYEKLGKLQVAEVAVVLDSCFSGAGGRSVLAKGARPLVMITTSTVLSSNIAVLSATQGTQISTSSPEKGHGIFTYYFLKALKDGKKNIAEIYEYIKPLVEDEAKQINVQQSPSISPDVEKLKGRFSLRK